MNYIELINKFWQLHEIEEFLPNEIALYFYLLKINNSLSWTPSFRRNNSKINADLGMSYKVLSRSRNRLKQSGLIDFKTKNGSPNTTYFILTFVKREEVMEEVKDEVLDEVRTRSGRGHGIDKINRNLNVNLKEKESSKRKSYRFSPPQVSDVYDYMLEKKLPDQMAKTESQKFVDFYESKNWYVGKNKMSNWKSAVSGWINRMQKPKIEIKRKEGLAENAFKSNLEAKKILGI